MFITASKTSSEKSERAVGRGRDPGGVDEDVDTSERFEYGVDQESNRAAIGEVDDEGRRFGAGLLRFLRHARSAVGVAVDHGDAGTRACECVHGRAADSRSSTGDRGDLAVKRARGHARPPSRMPL